MLIHRINHNKCAQRKRRKIASDGLNAKLRQYFELAIAATVGIKQLCIASASSTI